MKTAQAAWSDRGKKYAADTLLHREDISAEMAKKLQLEFKKEARQLMKAAEEAGEAFELPDHLKDLYRPPVRYFHDPRGLATTKTLREQLEDRLFAEGNQARAKVIQAEKRMNKNLDYFSTASERGLLSFEWKDPRGVEAQAEKRRNLLSQMKKLNPRADTEDPILNPRLLRFLGKAEKLQTVRTLVSEEYRNQLNTEYASKVEQVAKLESLGDLFLEASILKRAENVLDAGLRKIHIKPEWEVKKYTNHKITVKGRSRIKNTPPEVEQKDQLALEEPSKLNKVDMETLQNSAAAKPPRSIAEIYNPDLSERRNTLTKTYGESFRISGSIPSHPFRKLSSPNLKPSGPVKSKMYSTASLLDDKKRKFQGSILEEGSTGTHRADSSSPIQARSEWRETPRESSFRFPEMAPKTLQVIETGRFGVRPSVQDSLKSIAKSARSADTLQQRFVKTSHALVDDIRRFVDVNKKQGEKISREARKLQRTYRQLKDRSNLKKMEKRRAEALLSDFEKLHGMVDKRDVSPGEPGTQNPKSPQQKQSGGKPLEMLSKQRASWYGIRRETNQSEQPLPLVAGRRPDE